MNATTSLGALYRAFHADAYPDHDPDDCGCSDGLKRLDMGQAVKFEELLSSQGWMLVPKVSVPRSVPKGDPADNWQTIDDVSDRAYAVWWLLSFRGPLTDNELVERYDPDLHHWMPKQGDSSIRSRRAELVRAGLVEWTGEKRPTGNGGSGKVWRALGEPKQVAA